MSNIRRMPYRVMMQILPTLVVLAAVLLECRMHRIITLFTRYRSRDCSPVRYCNKSRDGYLFF